MRPTQLSVKKKSRTNAVDTDVSTGRAELFLSRFLGGLRGHWNPDRRVPTNTTGKNTTSDVFRSARCAIGERNAAVNSWGGGGGDDRTCFERLERRIGRCEDLGNKIVLVVISALLINALGVAAVVVRFVMK